MTTVVKKSVVITLWPLRPRGSTMEGRRMVYGTSSLQNSLCPSCQSTKYLGHRYVFLCKCFMPGSCFCFFIIAFFIASRIIIYDNFMNPSCTITSLHEMLLLGKLYFKILDSLIIIVLLSSTRWPYTCCHALILLHGRMSMD